MKKPNFSFLLIISGFLIMAAGEEIYKGNSIEVGLGILLFFSAALMIAGYVINILKNRR